MIFYMNEQSYILYIYIFINTKTFFQINLFLNKKICLYTINEPTHIINFLNEDIQFQNILIKFC